MQKKTICKIMKKLELHTKPGTMFHHLRQSPDRRGVVGVGTPSRIPLTAKIDRMIDGVTATPGDGSEWLFYVDAAGALKGWSKRHGEHTLDPAPASEVAGGVMADGCLYIFLKGSGARCFRYAAPGVWEERELFCAGACSIVRRDMSTETAAVGPVALVGAYDTRVHVVSTADAKAVGAALRDAYLRVASAASASHRCVQPVMARYKLYGRDGALLYTSAPVMVVPEQGLQMTETPMEISLPDCACTSAMTLSAQAFGLECVRAEPEAEIWERVIGRVEIETAPQLHPLSLAPGAASVCRYQGTQGQRLGFACNLPGFGRGVEPGAPGGIAAGYAEAVLAFADEAFRPWSLPLGSVADEVTAVSGLTARLSRLAPAAEAEALLSAPNRFTASAAASGGGSVMYGGLASIPFGGWNLAELAISVSDLPAGISTALSFDIGRSGRAVACGRVEGRDLARFSPLIAYPSPRGVSAELRTSSGRLRVGLRPSRCGRWSFYLAPSCRPLELEGTRLPFEAPAGETFPDEWPHLAAVARSQAPLALVAVGRSPVGPVSAICPAARSGTVWEFGRESYYLFGPGGIAGLVAGKSLSTLSAAVIDARGVDSARAVASVPGAVAALAGGDLVRLVGSRVSTLAAGVAGSCLGYEPRWRELWCSVPRVAVEPGGGDPPVTAVDAETGWAYTRSDVVPASFCALGREMLMLCADGSLRRGGDEVQALLSLGFVLSASPGGGSGWRRRLLSLPVSGRGLNAKVEVRVSQDGRRARKLAEFGLSGDVGHPVPLVVALPHCHEVSVDFSAATMSPLNFSLGLS